MAHGDYSCCGVCSSKMMYEGFSEHHKTQFCENCLVLLRDKGTKVLTVKEFIDWINKQDVKTLPEKLKEIGFDECYYENEIDTTVRKKLGLGDDDKPKNSFEFLQKIGVVK